MNMNGTMYVVKDGTITCNDEVLIYKQTSEEHKDPLVIPLLCIISMKQEASTTVIDLDFYDENRKKRYMYLNFECTSAITQFLGVMKRHLEPLGYEESFSTISIFDALLTPGIACIIIGGLGALLSKIAFDMEHGAMRTKIVRGVQATLYRIADFIGYVPCLIITLVLVGGCLIWALKRLIKRPKQRRITRT